MFSFQSWDTEIGSNFKDMAIELAKNNRVLFVNRALDRSSLRKHKNDAILKPGWQVLKPDWAKLNMYLLISGYKTQE